MAFNEKAVLRFLYQNDNGDYWLLNDIIKEQYVPGDEERIRQRLQYLSDEYIEMEVASDDFDNPLHITKFGFNGIVLKNFLIKARITAEGRDYYQKVYLAQDKADEDKITTDSILSTNWYIKLTFGAFMATVFLGIGTILVTRNEGKLNRQQIQEIHQEEQLKNLPAVKIYLNDSLQKTVLLK